MKALITSAVLAATSLMSPASAGLHDFDPSRVTPRPATRPVASRSVIPSTVYGNCFVTNDQSRVCYMQIQKGIYFAAVYDVDYPRNPIAITVNCNDGAWGAYGDPMTQRRGRIWAKGLCASINA